MSNFSDGLTSRLDALQAIPLPDWIEAHTANEGYVIRCGRCSSGVWPTTLDGAWAFFRRHVERCGWTDATDARRLRDEAAGDCRPDARYEHSEGA